MESISTSRAILCCDQPIKEIATTDRLYVEKQRAVTHLRVHHLRRCDAKLHLVQLTFTYLKDSNQVKATQQYMRRLEDLLEYIHAQPSTPPDLPLTARALSPRGQDLYSLKPSVPPSHLSTTVEGLPSGGQELHV